MPTVTRCKFALIERTETAYNPTMRRLVFEPRYDATMPEDIRFNSRTPSGRFEIVTDNPYMLSASLGSEWFGDWIMVEPAAKSE